VCSWPSRPFQITGAKAPGDRWRLILGGIHRQRRARTMRTVHGGFGTARRSPGSRHSIPAAGRTVGCWRLCLGCEPPAIAPLEFERIAAILARAFNDGNGSLGLWRSPAAGRNHRHSTIFSAVRPSPQRSRSIPADWQRAAPRFQILEEFVVPSGLVLNELIDNVRRNSLRGGRRTGEAVRHAPSSMIRFRRHSCLRCFCARRPTLASLCV
jgi:hypothetical protein